jgi:osmotically inducible protein OsmC
MKRTAKARWTGDLNTGHGDLTTESLALNQTQYSFKNRFEQGVGSNPEELLAAAHAGCFTMSLAYALSQKGFRTNELETTAVVNLDLPKGGITGVELNLNASLIDGLPEKDFLELASSAEKSCLLSKALSGLKITLNVNYGGILQPEV